MAILNPQPRMLKGAATLASLAALACACGSAQAASITWYMTNMFSGTVAPPGYMKAVLTDVNSTTVSLSLENFNFISGEFADSFYLNVNTAFTNPATAIAISYVSGQAAAAVQESTVHQTSGGGTFKADGDGFFDFVFQYSSSGANRFTDTETSVYNLVKSGGLSVSDFDFSSQGSAGGYKAATHIQGYPNGSGTSTSAWMSPGPPPIIPLPATAGLASLGLLVVPAIRRRPIAR